MFLCNNSNQTSFSDTFTSAGPSGRLETPAFQHLPWGPADVNAEKILFDPYSEHT